MSEINLEALGLTTEDLRERVVERCSDRLLSTVSIDEDGFEHEGQSYLAREIKEAARKKIDESVTTIANEHLLPRIQSYIEGLVLQETNRWGEKKGTRMTFTEYLVARAEQYMNESVDWSGKPTPRGGATKQTRLAHLIHEHLHYQIEGAVKQILRDANASLTRSLEETIRMKLAEVAKSVKVGTTLR